MTFSMHSLARASALCAALAVSAASAHVVLPPEAALAGSHYDAAFSVGHACTGAQATTALVVQLPAGFRLLQVLPHPGWSVSAPPAGTLGGEVRWSAQSPEAALHGHEKAVFTVRGQLPETPGTLYFPVQQLCDVGQSDWVQIPTPGDSAKLPMPAARLQVRLPE